MSEDAVLPVIQPVVLDLLDTAAPALSSTSDMPVVETKPDATPSPAEPSTAVPPEQSGEVKPEEDSESATESDTDEHPGPPRERKGVGKKLDLLTKQRDEQTRIAAEANARLDRALAALERAGAAPPDAPVPEQPAAEPEPVRPSKTDYNDPDQYEQAIIDYSEQRAQWISRHEVQRAKAEAQQQHQREMIQQAQQAAHDAYMARVTKAKAEIPDWEAAAESPDVMVTPVMAVAIRHSEYGPQVQYHLGKHPEEAARIAQLLPPLQLLEIGRLEAKLTAAPPARPAVSKAPQPIAPLTGVSASASKDPDSMSMDEYAAYRHAQMRSGRAHR